MPVYEYQCDDCTLRFEKMQRFSEDPIRTCPNCGGPVHRVIQPVGVIFKGSGFYETDYRSDSYKKAAKAERKTARRAAKAAAQAAQRHARRRIVEARLHEVQSRIDPRILFDLLDTVRRLYDRDALLADLRARMDATGRPRPRAIVIGAKGATLKEVGRQARQDMEKLFDRKVFLETWVKVREGWSDDERALRSLGYQEDS